MTSPIAALVFDFDGLILDTEMPEYVSTCETLQQFGLDYPLDEWLHRVGTVNAADWLDWAEVRLERRFTDAERIELRTQRRARNRELVAAEAPRPGVVELLDGAEQLGIRCAIASSAERWWVVEHLATHGLSHYFAAIRCFDDVGRAKPAPDLYLAACDALGTAPSCSIAFEDSFHGATAAKAAGLFCVACPGPLTLSQDLSLADIVVASLSDVDLTGLARLVGLDHERGDRLRGHE